MTPQQRPQSTWISFPLITLCLGSVLAVSSAAPAELPPNIVLILTDDMGYGDVGCYGHPLAKTPHIDELARQGVRFTQHYSNGTECSPTRTALLTGRYQQRAGGLECAIGTGNVGRYDDAIRLAEQHQLGLPADQTVIPGKLKEVGYACGVFGKWHLGYEPHFNPLALGWDEFCGYLGGNVHYFTHRELSDLPVMYSDRSPITREGYMTHLITDDSIAFVERHKRRSFFLYVAHECPHFPFQGPSDGQKVVNEENWTARDAKTYVAMLEDLDAEVGRLLAAIDSAGLAEQTVVVFVSDNGGLSGAAHMGGLRGAKSTTWEGGIRVPLIIRWPGQIQPGIVSSQVSVTFDLTHSFLRLARADISDDPLDGVDIIRHVVERRDDFSRTLFWRGRRGERTWWAVRDGDVKYVRQRDGRQISEWLFNLANDVGEQIDTISTNAPAARRLTQLLDNWEQDVKATR